MNVFEDKNSGNMITKRVLQFKVNDSLDSIM